MANLLGLAGAQPQKETKFAPIYNGRWSSGIITNRSPLRDGTTTRLVEKFYGAAGDALIAGNNVEITNKLTLARRAGNSVYDSNSYSAIDRFYDFRIFGATTEQINVMIDQAGALYSLYAGTKTLVWEKLSGAGQSYMQSVGNSLYWGDGASNKKWLESLTAWSANAAWNTSTTPFYSTFFIDGNGNIQQLTGTVFYVTEVAVSADVLTVTSSFDLSGILSEGCEVTFPGNMAAAFLDNQTVTVDSVSGFTFTASLTNDDYGPAAEARIVNEVSGTSTPSSGGSEPTWSTQVPDSSNYYQGGLTDDGSAQWTNRGNPVENWGLANGTKPIAPIVGSSTVSWQTKTYFSLTAVIVDSNGNVQQVSTAGKSGSAAPSWATSVGNTTTDGTVVWRMIQTAASLAWASHTDYIPSTTFALTSVATASGSTTIYTGTITGGASNAYAGKLFVIGGFTGATNNGTFLCSASTATTLTLNNAGGVSETAGATASTEGQFIVGSAYGTNCLFQLGTFVQPTLTGNVSAYLYPTSHGGAVGAFTQVYPVSTGSASASDTTLNSLNFGTESNLSEGTLMKWNTINGAGEITGYVTPFPTYNYDYDLIILGSINVPVAGQYTFTMKHQDGCFWGMGNGATLVSGPSSSANTIGQTVTAAQGYPSFGGTNGVGGTSTDTYTVNFPSAGVYTFEVNYHYWYHSGQIFTMTCNGLPLANGTPESGTNAPVWPAWTTSYAPNYPTVTETDGSLTWENIGPLTDFAWAASTNFTLPDTTIIDANGNTEAPYRAGVTGSVAPTFQTGINQLTLDNPNLIWINEGTAGSAPTGTVSTFNGGWQYGVALVNTLDNTVSNCTPLSAATGNFIGVDGISIAPGAGLPILTKIDPQADYVAIFRTTDGQATPFLIPGTYTTYTVSLSEYLQNGYVDTTPDTELNNLISGAIAGENTPPGNGAQNLTYHLNRLFYSIGNVVYWTAGADTPVGNGVNGTPPLNYDTMPSLVKRIVATATGAIIFTVSDVYVIQGQGTASSPLQSALPLMEGVGLLSYNALDINGSIIGFFTTDNQFCIVDPSAGNSYAGFPIGDQLRLNNGTPGQSWNPANVYVTWYVNGEDQGWYVSDGTFGWYKLIPTPSPETGYTWSPFATIVGGCQAVQSIEVTPGVHKLLVGPTGTGPILYRDLTNWQDNGSNYTAWAVVGSAVLAQPGQVASIGFITTESVRTGTPLTLGILLDEALPYYTGPFDILKYWVSDPPGLKPSRSFYAQRFYLNESKDEAVCRHMQMKIQWAAENAANELQSLTVYGGYFQEN